MTERGYEEDIEFSKSWRSKAPTFEQAVQMNQGAYISNKDKAGLSTLRFSKDDASIAVSFVEMEAGPRVASVNFAVKGIDDVTFRERVHSKYGEPDSFAPLTGQSRYTAEDVDYGEYELDESVVSQGTSVGVSAPLHRIQTERVRAIRPETVSDTDF